MRKPNPNINPELGFSDDLLWSHHIVETMSDTLMDMLDNADDFEPPVVGDDSPQDLLDAGMSAKTLATYTSLMAVEVVHDAIHDMMNTEGRLSIDAIEDRGFRRTVKAHEPRIMSSDKMPQSTKDEINRVLGRKV